MHANSRFVSSAQTAAHDQLLAQVDKHASTLFRKPVASYNRDAFEACTRAWRAAGSKPLILDAGCGIGWSTLHLAAHFPEHFVIGIDQSADRLARRIDWPGGMPANCIRIRADLVDFWRLMLQAGMHPQRHYLLYPNPWPKKQHLGRRWHGHPVFPTIVALGGLFECRSNWRIYIEECAAALQRLTGIETGVEPYLPAASATVRGMARLSDETAYAAEGSGAPITPFERKYLASGHSLWRVKTEIVPAAFAKAMTAS